MLRIKRGDTFSVEAVVKGDGVALDITDWVIRSQIRTKGLELIETPVITITDATNGVYTIEESAAGVTAAWPVGELISDIEYTHDGSVISTKTFSIFVDPDVTV